MFKGSPQVEKCPPCPSVRKGTRLKANMTANPINKTEKNKDPIKWQGIESSNKVLESEKNVTDRGHFTSYTSSEAYDQHQQLLL